VTPPKDNPPIIAEEQEPLDVPQHRPKRETMDTLPSQAPVDEEVQSLPRRSARIKQPSTKLTDYYVYKVTDDRRSKDLETFREMLEVIHRPK
jgi:hypothetical protein